MSRTGHEFLIVGGGVIGLSIAWELACRGKRVCIVDGQEFGAGTSWVGAGIFPPPLAGAKFDALEQLRAESHALHVEWSRRLAAETHLDNELRECGGVYFARSVGEAASLRVAMQQAANEGVVVEELSKEQLVDLLPALQAVSSDVKLAYHLPEEMQLRSPRHLQALVEACHGRCVDMHANVRVRSLVTSKDRITGVQTESGLLNAEQVILCCGPWSSELLEPLDIMLPIEPWRGQLILWKTPQPLLAKVVNEGLRYLVPREDGHLLAGATVEDVGFDCQTTDEAIEELRAYSCELIPELKNQDIVQAWAGLRPKTPDGLPFMDRVPGFANLSVAAGHYRSGLHLSPATAVFMAQLLLDDTPPLNAAAFRINR